MNIRDRIIKYGIDSVSDEELSMFVFGRDVKCLRKWMKFPDKLSDIDNKSKLAFQLAERLINNESFDFGERLSASAIGKKYVQKYYSFPQEELVVLFLDNNQRFIKEQVVFRGTINKAAVHQRDIFREAIKISATKIILIHNHPSGEINVSKNDLQFTKLLVSCGKLLDCEVVDHFIIGNKYLSFKENKLM